MRQARTNHHRTRLLSHHRTLLLKINRDLLLSRLRLAAGGSDSKTIFDPLRPTLPPVLQSYPQTLPVQPLKSKDKKYRSWQRWKAH